MLKSTIEALRELLDGQRVLSLAVLVDGAPCAGLLPFAALPERNGVLIHASRLARHSRGLAAHGRASVLLHVQDSPDQDPLQIRRATFDCEVRPLERDTAEWQAGRDLYVRKFSASDVTFQLSDFTLYRLEFEHGLYVAGFGRAIAVPAADIARLA